MASKEFIEILNSLPKEKLVNDYIEIDNELNRMEGIEIKCFKLEEELEVYKKAFNISTNIVSNLYKFDIDKSEFYAYCKSKENDTCDKHKCKDCIKEFSLYKARKELENGK